MLTLYYGPGACSMASHIVLEESGEKYTPKRMDLAKGEQRTPDYLKMNPQGRVPLLQLVQGRVEGQVVLVVTDLKVQVKQTDGDVLVRVAGKDLAPVAGARVRLRSASGAGPSGTTDARGEVHLATTEPRLLVQHVLVDGSVAQHAHTFLKRYPLGAHLVEFGLQHCGTGAQLVLRVDAEFAVVNVIAEIGQHRQGERRHDQAAGPAWAMLACPHLAILESPTSRPILLNARLRARAAR